MAEAADSSRPGSVPGGFITGLGIAQIISWGTLYYSFPLIAAPMAASLGISKAEAYAAASIGLSVGAVASYPVGRAIDRGHGRAVMAGGALLGCLLLLAWSAVGAAWLLYPIFAGIGVAQAMSLYEPAFAVISRRSLDHARERITRLTLWGGFASTVFVPLLQTLLLQLGWRQSLAVLAVFQLAAALVNYAVLQGLTPAAASATRASAEPAAALAAALRMPAFWALVVAFAAHAAAFSALSLHLYPLLQEHGAATGTLVVAMASIGPAQVAGRVLVWRLGAGMRVGQVGLAVMALLPASIVILWFTPPTLAWLLLFALLYGAANGIVTIVRGLSIPEMVSKQAYGALNGVMTAPATALKALAPLLAALLWSADSGYRPVVLAILAVSLLMMASFALAVLASVRAGRSGLNAPGATQAG